MEEYKQNCNKCGKKFLVHITSMNVPGGKDREEVVCPYCNADNGYRMTSGFVYTYPIKDEK